MSDIKQLISIIVPVFNESESIGLLLDEVINLMSSHKFNFELIVVNDGSKDNTCLLYTSPSPRDCRLSRMPSSA